MAVKVNCRGHSRWCRSPRTAYPDGRIGYHLDIQLELGIDLDADVEGDSTHPPSIRVALIGPYLLCTDMGRANRSAAGRIEAARGSVAVSVMATSVCVGQPR